MNVQNHLEIVWTMCYLVVIRITTLKRCLLFLNLFHATGFFLYPLKTWETRGFWILSGGEKETNDKNWFDIFLSVVVTGFESFSLNKQLLANNLATNNIDFMILVKITANDYFEEYRWRNQNIIRTRISRLLLLFIIFCYQFPAILL